jgi:tRNA(Ile2) C34 agmatinyltransferase TiaS
MRNKEFKDHFSEAITESGEKSGYICKTCGTHLTEKKHAGLIKKLTSGVTLREPAPFGP